MRCSSLGNEPIYLVGYMGSGKSTIGRILARKLDFQFIDTDIFIESRFRRRILDMFSKEGEDVFRRRERMVIEELSGMTRCVIATGGGLPCHSENMSLMNETGITTYLEVSDQTLAYRLELYKHTRPSIKEKNLDELLEHVCIAMSNRRPIYQEAAITYSTERLIDKMSKDLIAQEIVSALQDYTNTRTDR